MRCTSLNFIHAIYLLKQGLLLSSGWTLKLSSAHFHLIIGLDLDWSTAWLFPASGPSCDITVLLWRRLPNCLNYAFRFFTPEGQNANAGFWLGNICNFMNFMFIKNLEVGAFLRKLILYSFGYLGRFLCFLAFLYQTSTLMNSMTLWQEQRESSWRK